MSVVDVLNEATRRARMTQPLPRPFHYSLAFLSPYRDQMDPDNPAHVPPAKIVVEALIGHLEAKAQEVQAKNRRKNKGAPPLFFF